MKADVTIKPNQELVRWFWGQINEDLDPSPKKPRRETVNDDGAFEDNDMNLKMYGNNGIEA